MNLFSFNLARRYLFAKKSTRAINIISAISVFGLSIGAAALILILSVFNGLEDLIGKLSGTFNPDIKITAALGKNFNTDSFPLEKIKTLKGIKSYSFCLEELALFEYEQNQVFGKLKGVDTSYLRVNNMDSALVAGKFVFNVQEKQMAVLGSGIDIKLNADVENPFFPLKVYMPQNTGNDALEKPFRVMTLVPSGVFAIQQDFDNEYVLSSLAFAQEIMGLDRRASSLEIRISEQSNPSEVSARLQSALGDTYAVKDRNMQDESIRKLMNLEKWLAYAILCLMLVLIAFNLIGALWMIVIDKKQDISILKSMGCDDKKIRNIFLGLGAMYSLLGMVFGTVIAVTLYILQKKVGLIHMPQQFVVDTYPVSLRTDDLLIVCATVLVIGILASLLPAIKSGKLNESIR